MNLRNKYPRVVLYWLLVGVCMVFFQVVLGGITRLTESGLSITKWDIVSGTLPPLNETAWQEAFEMYKATPQYKEVNEGMSFSDFKFIFFWEFVHRFWARLMGFVFLIPFVYFFYKKYLDREILVNLTKVILLSILAATFGWIMVASGLIMRPWVNAYKLSLHLMIAFGVYIMLLWTYLNAKYIDSFSEIILKQSNNIYRLFVWFGLFLCLQVFLGGVLSGMKAAVIFPMWPDMNGEYLPNILLDLTQWNVSNFNNYDKNLFMPTLIHFLHRNTAYVVSILGFYLSFKMFRLDLLDTKHFVKKVSLLLGCGILVQITLGILTLVNSIGRIPIALGVLHQAGALLLISVSVVIFFILRPKEILK